MRHLAVFLFVLIGLVLPSHAEEKPRIAVLELKGELSRGQLSVLSDKVRSGVLVGLQGKDYVVMSRENMAILLKDMGLDCESVEGECEVETGRNIGAAYVVSGSIEDVGGGLLLVSLKVHDTQSGALKATGDVRGTQVIQLIDQLPGTVAQVMARAFGEGGQQAPIVQAPVSPGAPAQAQFNLNFGSGGGGLGVQAKLKEQECVRQADQRGSKARATRLADAIAQAKSKASQAWRAQSSELEMCTKLERSQRGSCISAVEQWLSVARSMKVDLAAGVETIQTDCGARQPAYQAETRMVAANEVAQAESLLTRLKDAGSSDLSGGIGGLIGAVPLGSRGVSREAQGLNGLWVNDHENRKYINIGGSTPEIIKWGKPMDSGAFQISKLSVQGDVLTYRSYYPKNRWWVNYTCRRAGEKLRCDGVNKDGKFTSNYRRETGSGKLKNGWRYSGGKLDKGNGPISYGGGLGSGSGQAQTLRKFPYHRSGSTPDLYRCRSSGACRAGSYCVDNNGDRQFFCKPSCTSTSGCSALRRRFPGMGCHEAYFADGVKSATRVCNERRVNVIDYRSRD